MKPKIVGINMSLIFALIKSRPFCFKTTIKKQKNDHNDILQDSLTRFSIRKVYSIFIWSDVPYKACLVHRIHKIGEYVENMRIQFYMINDLSNNVIRWFIKTPAYKEKCPNQS